VIHQRLIGFGASGVVGALPGGVWRNGFSNFTQTAFIRIHQAPVLQFHWVRKLKFKNPFSEAGQSGNQHQVGKDFSSR